MRPLFCLLPFLMNAATDPASGGEGGKTPGATADPAVAHAAAIKALEDTTLPMSQRFSVAMNALKGIDPTGQLAALQTKLTEAQASLTAKDTEITTLKAELATVKQELLARQTDLKDIEALNVKLETEAKDLRAKEQDLTKRADAKAKEKVAALGFPAAQLPAANAEISGDVPQNEEQLATAVKGKTWEEQSKIVAAYDAERRARIHGKN